MIEYFANNRVAANVLMLLFLGGGLLAANNLNFERLPAFDPRSVTVTVPYPGAAPDVVEEDITRRIEESVSGVVGVRRVLSKASEGVGVVTVELETLADAAEVQNAVRSAVERIENFPPLNAEEPEVQRAEAMRNVVTLTVASVSANEHDLREGAEALRDALLTLPSVAFVSLSGARDREIHIELSEEALRRHGLTIGRVANLLRASSFNVTGGQLRTDAGDVLISTFAKRSHAQEYEDIVLVAQPNGAVVRLRDVATVRDGFVEGALVNEVDGRSAIFVRVDAQGGQSLTDIARDVRQFIASYPAPPGTVVSLWHDETTFIVDRIGAVTGNAVIGIVLVFLTLLLIFDLRIALWIAMGIPISFLGSMVFFDVTGMSVNVLTMFAFFVVTGIVVDDAVVVGESIARQHELGLSGPAASIAGVRAVAGPVTAGALTTAVMFFALYPLDDAWGQLVAVMPVVIGLVLVVSLLEAFCILPGHLAATKPWSRSPLVELQTTMRAKLDEFVHGKLVRAISLAVRFPFLTVLVVVASVAVAAGLVATNIVSYVGFPSSFVADRYQAVLTMPQGTRFEATEAAARHVAEAARVANEAAGGSAVQSIAVLVGWHRPFEYYEGKNESPSGDHLATVEVKFNPPPLRTIFAKDFEHLWLRALGEVPGAETVSLQAPANLTPPTVSYLLSHDDEQMLTQAVADLERAASAVEAVYDVQNSARLGKRRYDVQLTEAGIAAGLTASSVATQLRNAFFGAEVQRIQRGREEIKVMVRYPPERRRSPSDLLDERVALPGRDAPLSTVAKIAETQDYTSLLRVDGRRAVTVTAWFDPEQGPAPRINAALQADALPTLRSRYPELRIEEHGLTRDASAMLSTLAWSFTLALIVVYGLLATQLRSFGLPLLALAGVPMAAVGAVVGHLVLGYEFTNMSVFGIVAIAGVAVNDTLILLDRYNRIRAEDADLPAIAAVAAAARHRARAIVLTTITTVMGLLPMLYDKSETLQFLVPMVISLGAGLVFSSLGVLFLVPAVVIISEMLASSSFNLFSRAGKA